jgi:hypothetical protein
MGLGPTFRGHGARRNQESLSRAACHNRGIPSRSRNICGSLPGLYSVSGSERPDYVPGQSLTPASGSTPSHWINPAAFAIPANGTFGNLGRNAFRARGIAQLDLGVSKFVPITERLSIRFRGDLFNVTNRAQYGAPNADVSTESFGVITTTLSNYATGRGTPRELQLSTKIIF